MTRWYIWIIGGIAALFFLGILASVLYAYFR